MKEIDVRHGQPETKITKSEFQKRYEQYFYDPRFEPFQEQIQTLLEQAWQNYKDGRKAPRTVKAGGEFHDPYYDLSVEWLETRQRLQQAEQLRQMGPARILVISGSPRNEHTCPGEESKSFRLAQRALEVIRHEPGFETDFLDLSLLTAEYGKVIHPCKGCVSTAMPLCHWPCSCYPHHSMAQSPDWMAEIYEKWTLAHGVMIVTPVHWYQVPSVLKLMIDRLVCADGGNTDPTSTHGKNAREAKQLELKGWDYPKHLAGRAFSVIVQGDAAGIENVKTALSSWLTDMGLIEAGAQSTLARYIGYYKPYATSHQDLDEDEDFWTEVENAASSLIHQVRLIRTGHYEPADEELIEPRKK